MESAACMAALPGAAAQPTCCHRTRAGAHKVRDSDYVTTSPVHMYPAIRAPHVKYCVTLIEHKIERNKGKIRYQKDWNQPLRSGSTVSCKLRVAYNGHHHL